MVSLVALTLVATTILAPTFAASSAAECDTSSDGTCTDDDDYVYASPYNAPAPYKAFEIGQINSSRNGNFGKFLDAGTGTTSLRWLASLFDSDNEDVSIGSYTAITADEEMQRRVSEEAQELDISNKGQIIIGNWVDGVKLNTGELNFNTRKKKNAKNILLYEGDSPEQFDTILVDYLIGAVDKFSPYFQDVIFHRLNVHLRPGGRMLILGMEPIADEANGVAEIASEMKHVRDACQLLAGERPYREYPLSWIERSLARVDGLTVVKRKIYPYKWTYEKIVQQIDLGRSRLDLVPSEELKVTMAKVLDELDAKSLRIMKGLKGEAFTSGFNYVVIVEKEKEQLQTE